MQRPSILFISVLSLFAVSCRHPTIVGSGASATETRSVSGYYSGIEVDAPVNATIQVQYGAQPSLTLSGFANVLKYVRTEVKDSVLHITIPDMVSLQTDRDLDAKIVMPALSYLSVSGAGSSIVHGEVSGAHLSVDISGGGDVEMDRVLSSEMDADLSGAGSLTIREGTVPKATYDISGAGKLHALDVQTADATIDISGAGSAELTANTSINADISGAGSVRYRGHPTTINKDVSGAGELEEVK